MGRRWLSWLSCACLLSGCFSADDDGHHVGTRPDARPKYMDAGIDACVPLSCAAAGASCGEITDDGCGQPLDCGTCADPATCGGQGTDNVCAIPTAERACTDGWCWESPAPMPFSPASMFARSDADVWAVGGGGVVMHYDGTVWRSVPANTSADLHDIWMASPTDGWLVGAGGTVRRWNGTTWTTVASGTTAALRGVWGFSPTEVWIVGDSVSRKWNGTSLTTPLATSTPSLVDVFVPAAGKPFAVGEGRVWAYTGLTWSAQTSDAPTFTSYTLSHIAGTAVNVFAVGREHGFTSGEELIFHWNGQTWTQVSHPGDPEFTDAFTAGGAVYGVSDESIIDLDSFARTVGPTGTSTLAATGTPGRTFVATTGGVLWSGTGGVWASRGFGQRDRITAIAEVGDTVFFGGDRGRVIEWRDGLVVHEQPTTSGIRAIGGPARDDVWIVDASSRLFHFDGRAWTDVDTPPFVQADAIHATDTEVRLLGRGIYRRTSSDWEEEPTGTTGVTWVAVDEHEGELFAVGHDESDTPAPHVAHRAGGTWTELPAPGVPEVCGIAVAAANDIWVAGNDGAATPTGQVAHWDGSAWTTTTLAGTEAPCAIAIEDGEVFVAGMPNDIQHRLANGTWTVERPVPLGPLDVLHATSTDVWAAGAYGAILRR